MNVLATVKRWTIFPGFDVSVAIDSEPPVRIGYRSPKDALSAYIDAEGRLDENVRVEETTLDGVTVAYALSFDPHFRDWSLLGVFDREETAALPVGTCVEGIAVEFDTPGFERKPFLAIANAFGPRAPRTNVARTALEDTVERANLLRNIYKIYFDHVAAEAHRLIEKEGYSLTWATEQITYIGAELFGDRQRRIRDRALHRDALSELPMYLIETNAGRSVASLAQLMGVGSFWTIESQLMRSVEFLIREAETNLSAKELLAATQRAESPFPSGPVVANLFQSDFFLNPVRASFEVVRIRGQVASRRLDFEWASKKSRWLSMMDVRRAVFRSGSRDGRMVLELLEQRRPHGRANNVHVPLSDVTVEALTGYSCVLSERELLLLPDNPIARFLASIAGSELESNAAELAIYFDLLTTSLSTHKIPPADAIGNIQQSLKRMDGPVTSRVLLRQTEFLAAVSDSTERLQVFDPFSWGSRDKEDEEISF